MGLGIDLGKPDDKSGDGKEPECNSSSKGCADSCSICLDVVADDGYRSWAKLNCGHQFHLDCIGSAFNAKGAMQCPNCRKTEKGKWLYGYRPSQGRSVDEWPLDEDLYGLSYSEMSFGIQWCPFESLVRPHHSFEEMEFSSNTYHDHHQTGHHTVFVERAPAGTSPSHPCPHVAYFGPYYHPSSSSSSRGTNGIRNFPSSYDFPPMDFLPHFAQTNDQSFVDLRGSNARARDRVQALQAYSQQQPGAPRGGRRSSNFRDPGAQMGMPPSYDQSGVYFGSGGRSRIPESDNMAEIDFYRQVAFRQVGGGTAYHSFRPPQGYERMP